MKLAERLHETMVDAGYNQLSLATEAGLQPDFVRDIIRGKVKSPSAEGLCRVAEVLCVTPQWLLFGETCGASGGDKLEHRHERLKHARIAAGYATSAEVARKIGARPSTVRAHESGQNGFDPDQAAEYARLYGVEIEWLLFGNSSAASTSPCGNSETQFLPASRPSGSEGNGAAPAEKITLTITVSPRMAKRILALLEDE